jgi:glycosyltransferase involved in cell wall biosynthesis
MARDVDRKAAGHGPPLRILMSANSFWNIANFRKGLVDSLVRHGHDLLIAAPDPDIGWAASRGIETAPLPLDRSGLNPVNDIKLLTSYYRLFRQFEPDIFLGYTAKPNIYGSIAARLIGATTIPNISGLGTAFMREGPLSWLVSQLYRLAFRRSPVVFFQNADDRDLFLSRRIVRPDQPRLLPGSGVDLDHFSPAPASSCPVRFLFVGRLLGDKGVREFVEAARQLKQRRPDWQFQLLGALDRGNRSAIRARELDDWVSSGIVEHHGHTKDVRPLVAAATAVVLPSYREGMPRSLLEAAAMARPMVATDVPGNRQLVIHGVNGLLCKVKDAGSLAEAMMVLGDMPLDAREAMGRAGRKMVQRSFGEALVIDAYLEALAQQAPAARA